MKMITILIWLSFFLDAHAMVFIEFTKLAQAEEYRQTLAIEKQLKESLGVGD